MYQEGFHVRTKSGKAISKPSLDYKALRHLVLGILLVSLSLGQLCLAKERKVILATFHPQNEPSMQMISKQLKDFTRRTGIDVEYKSGIDLNQVLVMIAAGTPPDVFWIGDTVLQFGLKGALADLMPYVKKDKFDLERFFPVLLGAYSHEGKLYGLPNDCATAILYFNRELFDSAGLTYPDGSWDWDKFASAAQKLTKRNPDGTISRYGFSADMYVHMVLPWIWSSGGRVLDDARKRCLVNSPAAERGLEFLGMLMHRLKVMLTGGASQRFLSGQAAMLQDGAWLISTQLRDRAEFAYGIAPLPKSQERATIVFYGGFGMASNAKHKDEAWELLKYFASDEGQSFLVQQGFAAVPSVRSAALKKDNIMKAFGDPRNRDLDLGIIPESLLYSRTMPIIPKDPAKVGQVLGDVFGKFLRQEISSRAALEEADRLITAALTAR